MFTDKILNKEMEKTEAELTDQEKRQLLLNWSINAHYRGSKLEATLLGMAADMIGPAR